MSETTSKKTASEHLRNLYINELINALSGSDDEVLRVGSNELALPCVDSNGEDAWVTITVKVPTGSRDGDPYDGYAMAEEYKLKCAEKVRKAEEAAAKKAAKISKDKAEREARAKAKAEREATK